MTIPSLTKTQRDILRDESIAVDKIAGTESKTIYASASGATYKFKPCSFSDIPNLAAQILKIEEITNEAQKSGKTEMELITEKDSPFLNCMAEIILFGLKKDYPEMTIEKIKDEFSIGDFPNAYEKALDLNAFLSGMQKVNQLK